MFFSHISQLIAKIYSMSQTLVGGRREKELLQKALHSDESEMVAVIGRRRVGKTFLIRTVYQGSIDLEITGVQNASRQAQHRSGRSYLYDGCAV